ncbi:MAG: methyltransferase [Sphingobacteriales bacterium]|nr:methyltransferase [Sphingobacteriales bacterium]
MSNNYFQFKQFKIEQERCALKISTDSCLLGAWVAAQQQTTNYKPQTILDIGAGTGLLMLMLAQKMGAVIEGIEIDKPSFEQATDNINASLWRERLNLHHGDIKTFSFPHQFDLIISNPPFYEGDLKSQNTHKNIAKHDEGLTLEQLIESAEKNLSANGTLAVLIPFNRTDELISKAMSKKMFCKQLLRVKQSVQHNFFRSILLFNRNQSEIKEEEISIKDADNNYTYAFSELLKDYYLYL